MGEREKSKISAHKAPRQARSSQLVEDILTAVARVLTEHGAHRFTTARVAERAGVSVGSLYQYFPNKASILFRLQTDEWRQDVDLLCSILEHRSTPPLERLRRLVHAFVRSEREEADMRVALANAAPFYRDAELEHDLRDRATAVLKDFMVEVAPNVGEHRRAIAMETIKMTTSEMGRRISEERALSARSEVYGSR